MAVRRINEDYKGWDVRLIWTVTYPSSVYPIEGTPNSFEIYGVDRGSISISRSLTKISSLEEYGQGWQEGVPSLSVTILEKEAGASFEVLRRLSARDIPFDLELSIWDTGADNVLPGEDAPIKVKAWIDGYETFQGCRVQNERANYNIAEFPIREFECLALRHEIAAPAYDIIIGELTATKDTVGNTLEGDGTYNTSVFNLTGSSEDDDEEE